MFNKQIRKLPGKADLASIAAAFGTDDLIPISKSRTSEDDINQKVKSSSMVGIPGGESADDSCSL